ncbi:MAG: hypothetical protein M3O22_08380 [Pseudomonadota bacterium]|nr:hypothetical protein [Pseudomonadota bacterium]
MLPVAVHRHLLPIPSGFSALFQWGIIERHFTFIKKKTMSGVDVAGFPVFFLESLVQPAL